MAVQNGSRHTTVNTEKYINSYNDYEKRMERFNDFKGIMIFVYSLYVLLVYFAAIPYMNNLKEIEWYQTFMDFIFVPAPHVCISVYLYGIALYCLTAVLVYIRKKIAFPKEVRLLHEIKAATVVPFLLTYKAYIVALLSAFLLGAIGKIIYMGIIWLCSAVIYICVIILLTTCADNLEDLILSPQGSEIGLNTIENKNLVTSPSMSVSKISPQENAQRIEELEENTKKQVFNQAINELNNLIGMDDLKVEVKKFVADIEMRKRKEDYGINPGKNSSLHMIFEGPPGTGKTTVARIMGKILYGVGYLPKCELVEVDRADLIGEYVGHTAPKVRNVFRSARGGVIFIDEAYSLTPKGTNGFENEAIDTIVKLMEDNRGDTVVIFAGYSDQMREFVRANPGLQSRIPYTFTFTPYSATELYEIFLTMLSQTGYKIAAGDTVFAKECIHSLAPYLKDSNARDIRTFHEKMGKEQNYRLSKEYAEKRNDTKTHIHLTEKEAKKLEEAEKENMLTLKRYEIENAFNFIKENKLRGLKQARG